MGGFLLGLQETSRRCRIPREPAKESRSNESSRHARITSAHGLRPDSSVMKFQYTTTLSTNTKGKLTKRPMIELELIGKLENINVLGLIDSGADTTMVNIDYAKVLGIDLERAERKEFIGIGNSPVTTFVSSVTMKVKHFDVPITSTVVFTDSSSVDVLLGQEDFFECFRIKFEKDHDMFDLSLAPKASK